MNFLVHANDATFFFFFSMHMAPNQLNYLEEAHFYEGHLRLVMGLRWPSYYKNGSKIIA